MAILISPDGVVQMAEPSRCIGCRNYVYACPFGVPKFDVQARLMKKCNLCYDRTAQDLKPWCAQDCPTQALWYGDDEEFMHQREGHPVNVTAFGEQTVRTRVYFVMPEETAQVDISALLDQIHAEAAGGEEGAQPRREEAWIL
jgi:Fe-S-cluster-containing dehydrogenase component